MMQRNNKWLATGGAVLGATLAVGAMAVMTTAKAQDDPGRQSPEGRQRDQGRQRYPGRPGDFVRPRDPGPPGGFGGPMMRGGGFGGAPVITANERYVFILRGNTIYKLDVVSLRVLAQSELPAPRMGFEGGRPPAGR